LTQEQTLRQGLMQPDHIHLPCLLELLHPGLLPPQPEPEPEPEQVPLSLSLALAWALVQELELERVLQEPGQIRTTTRVRHLLVPVLLSSLSTSQRGSHSLPPCYQPWLSRLSELSLDE
jgi:hypothetical protein